MLIIGDIHGDYKGLLKLLKRYRGEPAVQIGDFGIGFEGDPPLPDFPDELRFIRGNHDNPIEAYKTRHYLGDFGYQMIDELNVFFLSGAASADRAERTEGKDWWIGEELSLEDLEAAIDLYARVRPEIVLTHDAPDIATTEILRTKFVHKGHYPSRTAGALNRMYEIHQPLQWIFGHWHVRYRERLGRTQFRCLPPMGWCQIHRDHRDFRQQKEKPSHE